MTVTDIVCVVIAVPVGLFLIGSTLVGVPLFVYLGYKEEGLHPIKAVFWGLLLGVWNIAMLGCPGWVVFYEHVTGKEVL